MSEHDLSGFKPMLDGGFVHSEVPGRTDKHYVAVSSGSYVLPAEHIAALGEGNSNAGAKVVRNMFREGSKFGPRLRVPRFARGGRASIEPALAVIAGGETVLPPYIVRRIGRGDLKKGHDLLDRWVMDVRAKHIKKLKALAPPVGSKE